MRITFSPVRSNDALSVIKSGDTLIINGDTLDLSGLPDGAVLPSAAVNTPWIVGQSVQRIDGVLHLTLMVPCPAIPFKCREDARHVTHPNPITMTGDGKVPIPTWTPPTPPEPEIIEEEDLTE